MVQQNNLYDPPLDVVFNEDEIPILEEHNDKYFAEDGRVFVKRNDVYYVLFYPKYVVANQTVFKIKYNPDNTWTDQFGTYYGFRDDGTLFDPDPRCGVGIFSLPKDDPRNADCKVHDMQFCTPVYKMFNSEEDANDYLECLMEPQYPASAWVFRQLTGLFGRFFWKHPEPK